MVARFLLYKLFSVVIILSSLQVAAEIRQCGTRIVIDNGVIAWEVNVRNRRYTMGNADVSDILEDSKLRWELRGVFPYGIYPPSENNSFWLGDEDYLATSWKILYDDVNGMALMVEEHLPTINSVTTYRMFKGDTRMMVSVELTVTDDISLKSGEDLCIAQMLYAGSGSSGDSVIQTAVGSGEKMELYYNKFSESDSRKIYRKNGVDWFGTRALEYKRVAGLVWTPALQQDFKDLLFYLHPSSAYSNVWGHVALRKPLKKGCTYRFDCFYCVEKADSFKPVRDAGLAYNPDGSVRGRMLPLSNDGQAVILKWENPFRLKDMKIFFDVPVEVVGLPGARKVFVKDSNDELAPWRETPFHVRDGKIFFAAYLSDSEFLIKLTNH